MKGLSILFISVFLLTFSVLAQNTDRFSIQAVDLNLPQILDSITEKTGYFFSYNSQILPRGSKYTLTRDNVTLKSYLDELLVGTGIIYAFYEDQIILKRDPEVLEINENQSFALEGIVTDKNTGEGLIGVNVYLNGTTLGGVTDRNGYYYFENIPVGGYQIVFSYVGYEKVIYDFNVDRTGKMVINSIMEEDLLQLQAVTINSDTTIGNEYEEPLFNQFKTELLGNTLNSRECFIMNRDDLIFDYVPDSIILRAYSNQPLAIENRALGYVIYYDIELFESLPEKIRTIGNIQFSEMEPDNRREKKSWKRSREKAYNGSLQHFLQSLIDGNYLEEGFRMYKVEGVNNLTEDELEPLSRLDVMRETDEPLMFELFYQDFIYVKYINDIESNDYLMELDRKIFNSPEFDLQAFLFASNKRPVNQRSVLKLSEDFVKVDINGHIIKPLSVVTYGYWSWEKLADMVPIDYFKIKKN